MLLATSVYGGRLVFDHAAGIPTAVLQQESQERGAGHEHEAGEEHEHAPAAPVATDSAPAHVDPPGTPPHTHEQPKSGDHSTRPARRTTGIRSMPAGRAIVLVAALVGGCRPDTTRPSFLPLPEAASTEIRLSPQEATQRLAEALAAESLPPVSGTGARRVHRNPVARLGHGAADRQAADRHGCRQNPCVGGPRTSGERRADGRDALPSRSPTPRSPSGSWTGRSLVNIPWRRRWSAYSKRCSSDTAGRRRPTPSPSVARRRKSTKRVKSEG